MECLTAAAAFGAEVLGVWRETAVADYSVAPDAGEMRAGLAGKEAAALLDAMVLAVPGSAAAAFPLVNAGMGVQAATQTDDVAELEALVVPKAFLKHHHVAHLAQLKSGYRRKALALVAAQLRPTSASLLVHRRPTSVRRGTNSSIGGLGPGTVATSQPAVAVPLPSYLEAMR